MKNLWRRLVRAFRAFRMAFRGAPVVTAETVTDDSVVATAPAGPRNVRATRTQDGLEVVLYFGRDKAKGRRACEHSVAIGKRGIVFTVDGEDRTPPEWR